MAFIKSAKKMKITSAAKVLIMAVCVLEVAVISAVLFSGCKKKPVQEIKVIKLFSNLPDRNFGQGKLEQLLIDRYMEEHPDVRIEVECLDDAAYKTKFKVYCMERMPDIVSVWGQPAFMKDVVEAGVFLELDKDFYDSYNFKDGALDGFTYNGKLYGLPRNTDIAILYYNEHIFADYEWKIPQTFEELLDLAEEINSHGVTPVAMAGSDGWPLMMFFSDILESVAGKDYPGVVSYAVEHGDFSDWRIQKALDLFILACKKGLFQKTFAANDYGTAQNLFLSYKAAMFYMGSWESSMVVNSNYWDEVTPYIRAMTLPFKNKDSTEFAWFGGGYSISAASKNKDIALDFLNYIYKPENLSKIGLQECVGLSAQNEGEFITDEIPYCLKQIVTIADKAERYSGTPLNDAGSTYLKQVSEAYIQRLASGQITKQEFIKQLEEACK